MASGCCALCVAALHRGARYWRRVGQTGTVPEPILLIIFGGGAVGPINVSNAKLTCESVRSKVGIRVRSLY